MNYLRALILIPVFFVQFSGNLINRNKEAFQLAENRGKVHQHIKPEIPIKMPDSTKDSDILKKEEIGCVNSPVCRKETPLKYMVQPSIISKEKESLPVNATPCDKKHPSRRIPVSNYIRSIGTGAAQLL